MKNIFAAVLAGLILFAIQFTTAKGEVPKDDLDGTWLVTSWVVNGKAVADEIRSKASLVIRGDTSEFRTQERIVKSTFKLDPSASPKTIAITFAVGTNAPKTMLGIYELEGDVLRNCHFVSVSETQRPKEFSSEVGSGQTLIIYKRQRK